MSDFVEFVGGPHDGLKLPVPQSVTLPRLHILPVTNMLEFFNNPTLFRSAPTDKGAVYVMKDGRYHFHAVMTRAEVAARLGDAGEER